ncbi:MAG: penicillin-binding protein activator [Myxococcota bacterium]|nr:penicillin-binding protein activator [Myxococcota bacterium]
MASRPFARLVAVVLLLVVGGCASGGLFGLGSDRAEREAYEAALVELERDPARGRGLLEAFLETSPRSAWAADAALALARAERDEGRPDAALRWLRWGLTNHPRGERVDATRLELADLLRERGELDGAWAQATRARLSLLSASERERAHRLLAELAAERGDAAEQVRWLARVRDDAPDEATAAEVDVQLDAALATLPPDRLEWIAGKLGRRVPAARAWLRAAELFLEEGDPERARAALEQAARLPLTRDEAERLGALEPLVAGTAAGTLPPSALLPPPFSQVPATPALPPGWDGDGAIGVVLPLSGRLAAVADETLRGVMLAARIFDEQPAEAPRGGVRVLVRDSAGDAERAAAAVRELAADDEVVAVIGPLLRAETRAAARAAAEARVPLLTLTRREDVALASDQVFRLGLTRRMEAEALAEHAVGTLGLARFAILYPKDAYGREFEALLWQAVEARGARVVGVAGYDPDATDFAGPIRSLIGYQLLSDAEREILKERQKMLTRAKRLPREQALELRQEASELTGPDEAPLPPIVDFDALFVPDAHDKIALIAPQLAFHEIRDVRLLGSSAWHDPELIEIAGRHVDGAVFTSAFDESSPAPTVREFSERYLATYGEPPGLFAAQGFDAALLALREVARGRATPESVRLGMLAGDVLPGASGVWAMGPDGNARKRPFLVGIESGETVSLD